MPKEPEMERHTKLRQLMYHRGISQQELLERVEELAPDQPLMQSNVSRIMNGKVTDYKLCTLWRICQALECTPNDVLDWEIELPEVASKTAMR